MRILAFFLAASIWSHAAAADGVRVVTDIAPVHSLAARVMEGAGTPEVILRPGASPHGYALRPSEAAALESAELVIWIGPDLTPWLEGPLATLARDAHRLELLKVDGITLHTYGEEDAGGEQEDHGEHEDHDDHGDHVHDGLDPHAWLDPENAALWLRAIAEVLAEIEPANAELYRANAEAGVAEIEEISSRIEVMLGDGLAPYALYHDGYRYFEERFDLHSAFAIATGDAVTPGPARLAELRALAEEAGIVCIFTEPQLDTRLINTVAEGMDVDSAVLDPLGSEQAPGPGLYPSLLMAMAESMAGCAGPS